MNTLLADLANEHDALDEIVAVIADETWRTPTPSDGWDIADQITHLAYFDERAAMAIVDVEAFNADLALAGSDMAAYMEGHLARTDRDPVTLLGRWRTARRDLLDALSDLDPSTRLPWYGPPMSARSFATARLMETWAHGQDVVDALGSRREPTSRLRHIAFLGVRTFGWSFRVRGLPAPGSPVFVELAGPGGATWTWGDRNEADAVRGTAEDFCLVVTQRRNVADTALETTGDTAARWMSIAQAFAGPPGPSRPAGRFPRR